MDRAKSLDHPERFRFRRTEMPGLVRLRMLSASCRRQPDQRADHAGDFVVAVRARLVAETGYRLFLLHQRLIKAADLGSGAVVAHHGAPLKSRRGTVGGLARPPAGFAFTVEEPEGGTRAVTVGPDAAISVLK